MVASSSGIEQGSSENTTLPASLPAAINWVAPSEREDGTPLSLSEIAGCMIYYGASKGEYPSQIDINDNTAVQASLNSLFPGRCYFVVTTLDTNGRESSFSEEISMVK